MVIEISDTQLNVIQYLIEEELERQRSRANRNEKNIIGLENLNKRIEIAKESNRDDDPYDLGFSVNDMEERNIDYVMKESSECIRDYAKTKGQMSLMSEFDDIKKRSSAAIAMMCDLKSNLGTNVDFAKNKLKFIYAMIVEEIIKENKISISMAERKALIDSRYVIANEQLRVYTRYASDVKSRYEAFRDILQSIIQSISTARIGMIRDSYQDIGGQYIPTI